MGTNIAIKPKKAKEKTIINVLELFFKIYSILN